MKRYRLNYDVTDIKLREAIMECVQKGEEPTVKKIAGYAGVCVSTAYNHNCPDMIREALKESSEKCM